MRYDLPFDQKQIKSVNVIGRIIWSCNQLCAQWLSNWVSYTLYESALVSHRLIKLGYRQKSQFRLLLITNYRSSCLVDKCANLEQVKELAPKLLTSAVWLVRVLNRSERPQPRMSMMNIGMYKHMHTLLTGLASLLLHKIHVPVLRAGCDK